MSIDKLIARLEAATKGSRELDGAIAKLVVPEAAASRTGRVWGPAKNPTFAPEYTTSLDAALTLVPEGARVRELGQWDDNGTPTGWFCEILKWEHDAARNIWGERPFQAGDTLENAPPTAPLALSIAALKALAAAGQRQPTLV